MVQVSKPASLDPAATLLPRRKTPRISNKVIRSPSRSPFFNIEIRASRLKLDAVGLTDGAGLVSAMAVEAEKSLSFR